MLESFVQKCVIGVDLGGTNVRAAAYLEDGTHVGSRISNPSHAQDGSDAIIASIVKIVQETAATTPVSPSHIGMAIPGHIDDRAGLVRWAPNFGESVNGVFKNWLDFPFRAELQKSISTPISMGNDANLAALGEYTFGVGRNSAKCLVLITLGTGIGSGIIMRPEAVMGKAEGPLMLIGGNGGGAELGHTCILYGGLDCRAGTYGSIEGYCSRDGIVTRAVHRLGRGRDSLVRQMVGDDLSKVTPLVLSQAADKGDELAIEVWGEVGTLLGAGIANVIDTFAPDIVAIGGQIAKVGDWLLEPARKSARNIAIPTLFRDAQIVLAEQIEDAGILGGAALALQASS